MEKAAMVTTIATDPPRSNETGEAAAGALVGWNCSGGMAIDLAPVSILWYPQSITIRRADSSYFMTMSTIRFRPEVQA